MSDHYFGAADHGHLRIFLPRQSPGQREPDLEEVEAMDFPLGKHSYSDRDTSMAGRFQGSKHQGAGPGAPGGMGVGRTGMSIDERLPMQREEERRRSRDVAAEIETFFATRPDATWDLACAPAMHRSIVDELSGAVRQRLRRTITKDLVNQRREDVRAHFVGSM